MLRLAHRADRPKLMKIIEKKAENLFIWDLENKHLYKYYALGAAIIGGIALNNFESVLSFLHLTNFKFAKRLLKDKKSLDSTIKIEIPKDDLISFELPNIAVPSISSKETKITPDTKENKNNTQNIESLNELEKEILRNIHANKDTYRLSIFELESRKNDYIKQKSEIVKQTNTQGSDIQKLTDKISDIEKDIIDINGEITSKENLIKTLSNLEQKYLVDKKALLENESKNKNIHQKNEKFISYDQKLLLENDKKIEVAISELLNQIKQSNNIENVMEYNLYLSYLSNKLSNFSNLAKDEFALELMKIPSITSNSTSSSLLYRRLYSDIEIFNEFQFIKRELLNQIILQELNSCEKLNTYKLSSIPRSLSPLISKSTGLLLALLCPFNIYIRGDESEFVKKIKALHKLHVNVEIGNHVEAYESLRYFKLENELLSRLRYKLHVMAKQQMMVDALRSHLI